MNLRIEHLGFLAAVLTTGAFIPQAWMVWREKGAPGISTGMYLMFILGVALWLVYGVMIDSWPVVVANAVTLTLASLVLSMKLFFENRRHD